MCFLLLIVCFLNLAIVAKKMRNSQVLIQSEATVMIFTEEKTSDEGLRAQGRRLKSPRKYMVGHALRHNRAETYRFQSCLPKAMHGQPCRSAQLCSFLVSKCLGGCALKHDHAFCLFLRY